MWWPSPAYSPLPRRRRPETGAARSGLAHRGPDDAPLGTRKRHHPLGSPAAWQSRGLSPAGHQPNGLRLRPRNVLVFQRRDYKKTPKGRAGKGCGADL